MPRQLPIRFLPLQHMEGLDLLLGVSTGQAVEAQWTDGYFYDATVEWMTEDGKEINVRFIEDNIRITLKTDQVRPSIPELNGVCVQARPLA